MKLLDFLDDYCPPIVGIVVMLPVVVVWWTLYILTIASINIFVPFGRMDRVLNRLYRSKFNPDSRDREWHIKHNL